MAIYLANYITCMMLRIMTLPLPPEGICVTTIIVSNSSNTNLRTL